MQSWIIKEIEPLSSKMFRQAKFDIKVAKIDQRKGIIFYWKTFSSTKIKTFPGFIWKLMLIIQLIFIMKKFV
jgi:hypothetical protein